MAVTMTAREEAFGWAFSARCWAIRGGAFARLHAAACLAAGEGSECAAGLREMLDKPDAVARRLTLARHAQPVAGRPAARPRGRRAGLRRGARDDARALRPGARRATEARLVAARGRMAGGAAMTRQGATERPWTCSEVARLCELAGKATRREICRELRRSRMSVQKKAARLGLSLRVRSGGSSGATSARRGAPA